VSLLQRSNQEWKVWLFVVMLILGSATTLFQGFLYEPLGKEMAIRIAVAGMGLIVVGFVWTGIAVKCPKCQLKIFWHAITKEGFFSWFSWLLQVEACPHCGYNKSSPPTAPPKRKNKGLKRP
jgi:hypothetical protein